jgi:hypothetical protein
MKISSEKSINNMLAEYDFFEMSRNFRGSFENEFIDNNDGTITDKATGLMWQKGGSSSSVENRGAKSYIKQLNKMRFAGFSDWRVPTVEELASLIKKVKIKGVHIEPVFDSRQKRCWTVDACETKYPTHQSGAWIVNFKHGEVIQAMWAYDVWAMYNIRDINYVKAVRSVK